jgi:hypothetical protein
VRSTVSFQDRRPPLLRAYNWVGKFFLDTKLPWINLDEDKLLGAARRRAGSDDFGPEGFLQPFRVLLSGMKNEGRMTFSGRISAREYALLGLVARLGMFREIKKHPEILEQPVRRPLIIVGMPRTGTTLLHHLLARDPVGRPLVAWETLSPAPVGIGRARRFDFRALIAAFAVWMSKSILIPETAGMHKYAYNGPAECTNLIWPSFVWPSATVLPSVHEWFNRVGESVYDDAYNWYRMSLQVLHWQRPAQDHWVLKSPQHIWALDALARAVPEATIIHTHRNMNEVLPSWCSLSAAMMSVFTDSIKAANAGPVAMELTVEILERMRRARQKIDASRIADVRYPDLVSDPAGTIRRIYDEHGYEFTAEYEREIARWLESDRKSRRPKHLYSHERFGLDRTVITEVFADYHREFGVED